MEVQVVFIVGVGRSGTSLLMTLLNGHSKIAFTPETHFFRLYIANEETRKEIEKEGVDYFKSILETDKYFSRLNISMEAAFEPYDNGNQVFNLIDFYKRLLQLYLERKNKNFIGDKDPRYLDFLAEIKQEFPNAKVIQIYRDPRDVILSKTKAEWSAHRPYWVNAIISQVQLRRGRKMALQLFGKNYYELSYESLLSQPENTLTKLLSFVGVEFEPEILDLNKSAKELVDESEMQWKDNTLKPLIGQKNIEKWRKKLSPEQIRCTEIICKDWFSYLGYEHSKVKIGWLKETFYQFVFSQVWLLQLIYERKLKAQTKLVYKK